MIDLIIGAVLAVLFIAACITVFRNKKKGSPCCGCPMTGNCQKKNERSICDSRDL
ncbi:MAG: FeoB-associated Cys-rich membrane protein [Lachnospiraceae bacterium]|nr:FeoB-associated Cys-rich membrane protein [Lachnospiraceae bacterium]